MGRCSLKTNAGGTGWARLRAASLYFQHSLSEHKKEATQCIRAYSDRIGMYQNAECAKPTEPTSLACALRRASQAAHDGYNAHHLCNKAVASTMQLQRSAQGAALRVQRSGCSAQDAAAAKCSSCSALVGRAIVVNSDQDRIRPNAASAQASAQATGSTARRLPLLGLLSSPPSSGS
jgi:hypothetical protein